MFSSNYQRFVAGRYLLQQGNDLSSAILVVVAACVWLAAGMGAACLWYPLADITQVPPPNPPAWLIAGLGLFFVLPMVALAFAGAAWLRERSPRTSLLLGLQWSVVAIAAFGLVRIASGDAGLSSSDYALTGLMAYLAFVAPATWSVLLRWRRHQPASRAASLLALIFNPLAALAWLLMHKVLRKASAHAVVSFLLMLGLVAGELVLLRGALRGAQDAILPALYSGGELTSLWSVVVGVSLATGLAFGVWAWVGRAQTSARAVRESVAQSLVLFALIIATLLAYLAGVKQVGINLDFLGGWEGYTPPMEFLIPAYIAGAIGILSGVLLVVRYSFSFFTTVSIGGVTIGTMALVIVLSVMSGFETDLREKILGFNAHIQISHNDELQFTGYHEIEEVLAKTDGVIGYTPYLMTEAYMSNRNNYGNVTLKGIDPARVASVTEIVHNLVEGDERALEKIWPLAEDGSILGEPEDAPVDQDPDADFDLDDVPTDFSGGVESVPEAKGSGAELGEDALDAADLEDDDLDLGEITDFSGGLDEYVDELDGGLEPEEGGDNTGLAGLPSDTEDWDLPLHERDYVRPEVAVLDGMLVGQELVNQISLYTGQEIRVISPLPDTSPDGLSIPRLQNFRIAGKFMTGMYEYDLKYVYCSLSALQDFLDLSDEVNGIEVRVKDPSKTSGIVRRLQAELGPEYRVQDWKELNKALFSALKLEKIAMFFILVIIVLVASFSIVGNLIMVVIEKAKEIAILKTLGASNRGVMNIFITQGFFIGLVGTSLGLALGLGACYLGKTYGVPLDPDVYYIDKLPIQVEPWSIVIVGFAGVAISVVATIYPAFIAARMRPAKGLRWD